MTAFELNEKLNYYVNLQEELKNKDITTIVNARLEEKRAEITAEVKEEIEYDINKCDNYIELLRNLVEESTREEISTPEECEIQVEETETIENIEVGGENNGL